MGTRSDDGPTTIAASEREREVRAAIEAVVAAGRAPLAFLPTVRMADQIVGGAEGLLRLTDGQGRPIPPPEVIAVAESCDLLAALDRAVLAESCLQGARWADAVPERDSAVSVNLSAATLLRPGLADDVAEALAAARLDPARLVLEITEDALSGDRAATDAAIARLTSKGVRLVLDDFGTGDVSLAHLASVPLDGIKVDLSLVAALPGHDGTTAIVRAMVGMAEGLGLETAAEGIEDLGQLDALRAIGCRWGQGHLWSRPVPGDAVPSLLSGATSLVRGRRGRPPRRTDGGDIPSDDSVFATLVHEIRTPLTVAAGFAALLEHSIDPDSEEGDAARRIGRATQRIEHLLRNLEDVAKVDNGTLRLVTAPTDVSELVTHVVDDLRPALAVPLEVVTPTVALPAVALDAGRIEQTVVNLISNAAKFSPVHGRVVIEVAHDDPWVDISITDQGPGVDVEQLQVIFRKYGRGDRTGPGSGLGLYLARGVARAHGGDVRYRRAGADGGSTFTIRLPVQA